MRVGIETSNSDVAIATTNIVPLILQADLKAYTQLQKYVQKKCVKAYFESREAVGLSDIDPNLNLVRLVHLYEWSSGCISKLAVHTAHP